MIEVQHAVDNNNNVEHKQRQKTTNKHKRVNSDKQDPAHPTTYDDSDTESAHHDLVATMSDRPLLNSHWHSGGSGGTPNTPQLKASQGRALVSWGCSEFGQHGHSGTRDDVTYEDGEITEAALAGRVRIAACGSSHTIVVTDKDEIYSWGNGNSGQLGQSDLTSQHQPVQLHLEPAPPSDVTVVSVACGSRHSILVLSNGHVYSCGNNFYAQLGYDFRSETYKENQSIPCLVNYLKHKPVSHVSCGDKHTMFLFHNGTVAVVGQNNHGQLGDGGRMESVVPKPLELDFTVVNMASGTNHNLIVSDTGDVYVWGYCKACGHNRHDVLSPELKLAGKRVTQVAGGGTHSMALTTQGDVYVWGFGSDGQLGLGDQTLVSCRPRRLRHHLLRHQVAYIDCGESVSAAVTKSGHLYMWGKNNHVISAVHTPNHPFYHPVSMVSQDHMTESSHDTGSDHVTEVDNVTEEDHGRAIHSVYCGTWHAVALSGRPDEKPDFDEMALDSDDSATDPDVMSEASEASSRTGNSESKPKDSRIEGFIRTDGPMETSAPPTRHVTGLSPPLSASRGAKLGLPSLSGRGQTRLTLGEFYAMTDSSPSQNGSSRSGSVSSQGNMDVQAPPPSESSSQMAPHSAHVQVQAPTPQEILPKDQNDENVDEKANDDASKSPSIRNESSSPTPSSASSEVSESSLKKRMAENLRNNSGGFPFRSRDWSGRVSRRAMAPTLSPKPLVNLPMVTSPGHGHEFTPNILTPRSPKHARSKSTSLLDRAQTTFISKSTADHFVLPREPTSVAMHSMALVDLNQLRAGSLFEPGDEENEGQGHSQCHSNYSNCSSRMDIMTPASDLELQMLMGQKTPDRSKCLPGSVSDTPSAMSRQIRVQEMLGGSRVNSQTGSVPPFATPSPNFGRQTQVGDLKQDLNYQLMRSRTVYSQMGRGFNKFYRKPGLPGATTLAKPPRAVNRQHTFSGSVFGRVPGQKSGQVRRNDVFGSDPAHSHVLSELTPPSPRVHGIQTQLELHQTHTGHDDLKKGALFSSASSWRNRMHTTLGNDVIKDGSNLTPELTLHGVQTTLPKKKDSILTGGKLHMMHSLTSGHFQSPLDVVSAKTKKSSPRMAEPLQLDIHSTGADITRAGQNGFMAKKVKTNFIKKK